MCLLRLGGDATQSDGAKCDLTGVHVKEYSTPAVPGISGMCVSYWTVTYVFAAPDFNSTAGSVGEFAGVGSSRTLK